MLIASVGLGAGCKANSAGEGGAASKADAEQAGGEPSDDAVAELPPAELDARHQALADTADHFVAAIRELETTRDVTCWTSFRQLDNFIGGKEYSEFAALTKVEAVQALAHAVWAAASAKSSGPTVDAADIEAVFSIEAELPQARKAELQKFAEDQGWQQFRDYRTTGEHWRVLLGVVHSELALPQPTVEPLTEEGADRLALVTTRLSLTLLTESAEVATQARTPLIEAEHVRVAYKNILAKRGIPKPPTPGAERNDARANEARIPLTGQLIEAKIAALRSYNASTGDVRVELDKVTEIPLDDSGAEALMSRLMSMARFIAMGHEPMRSDNYLADGNFAPAQLPTQPYVEPAHVENVTQQIFPYLMLPNGDVKLRFEPRPGNVTERDLQGQDVLMTDHSMNAVRDTAVHWVVLQRVWKDSPYAMDPFAAEYLSELVSIVATFHLLRAQTIAKREHKAKIDAEVIGKVQDVGYVQVPPPTQTAVAWGPEELEKKDAALAGYRAPLFSDVTAKRGLPTELPETVQGLKPGTADFDIQVVMGSGIAVGDVDGDGFTDLFVAGEGLGRLYLNERGKRFRDATEAWKIPGGLDDARGPLFVDFDGDDDLDLVVLRSVEPSLLLVNEGGAFVDRAADLGFVTARGAHVATAFDPDGDGDLDLYVGYYGSKLCNEGKCEGRNLPALDGRNGTHNQLFRNDGGRFVEAGADMGVADEGWTLAASAFDYDLDGDSDLYLANDFGANPLLRNDGGKFTDVAVEVGAADRGSGMNVTFADLDDNGAFDVFVSNIDMFSKNIKIVFPSDASVVSLDDRILRSFEYLSGNKLYLNLPDQSGRRFEAVERVWFEPGDRGWGWSGLFFDYDLDGDEDFYLSNGWIPGSPAADQRNQMFIRDGATFYQAPEGGDGSETFAGNSRTAVAFDMDNDGDLDLAVNNYAAAPRLLENREKHGGGWVKLKLEGRGANTRAVGAVVELEAGGVVQRRLVTCGDGYLGQEEEAVHFGIGKAKEATVSVTWPDGTKKKVGNVAAGQVHTVSR
jgi:hypothetical protein